MDLPVTGQFLPEELYDYPPKIVCRFFPKRGAVPTTCTLLLHGFNKPVSVDIPLFPPQKIVDTQKLKVMYGFIHVLSTIISIVHAVDMHYVFVGSH